MDDPASYEFTTINQTVYVNQILCGVLGPWVAANSEYMVVEDNAPAHNNKRADAARKAYGLRRLVHAPYSPETNPVEGIWATMKDYIRRHPSRTKTYQGAWEVALEAYLRIKVEEVNARIRSLEKTRAAIEKAGGSPTGF